MLTAMLAASGQNSEGAEPLLIDVLVVVRQAERRRTAGAKQAGPPTAGGGAVEHK